MLQWNHHDRHWENIHFTHEKLVDYIVAHFIRVFYKPFTYKTSHCYGLKHPTTLPNTLSLVSQDLLTANVLCYVYYCTAVYILNFMCSHTQRSYEIPPLLVITINLHTHMVQIRIE